MASLLLVVQGLTHSRSPLIPELLLQNISLFLFKPWNEPVFTSAFCYCSLFSWNLFLFNSGGPKITANFLQGICSLKHTVWHFSFSSFFYFFYPPSLWDWHWVCWEHVSVVAFECCKVNAENDSLNGIIKADVLSECFWSLLCTAIVSLFSLLMHAPF